MAHSFPTRRSSDLTGPDLLNERQRYFGYGSVCVDDAEAWEIIKRARDNNPVQMPELKAALLMGSNRGQALVTEVVRACEGRFAVNIFNKLLALCGWAFEYIYEPVYRDNPGLLYEKNLHRFVAMFTFVWLTAQGGNMPEAIRQFQKYMRTRDEAEAPLLFEAAQAGAESKDPIQLFFRFARGYRARIIEDNARLGVVLPEAGRWVLDLSVSALWSHLNFWGRRGEKLIVRCDENKPLQASASYFTGGQDDPGIKRARLMGHTGPLGWECAKPVEFVDSRSYPAVQLVDVIAGSAVYCLNNGIPKGFEETFAMIGRHFLDDCVLPDMDVVDIEQRIPMVNYLILMDLARRADADADPYEGLEELYRQAEVSWAQGTFS